MSDMELNLQPVVTQRASEAIYEQIKALIISGHLSPGDKLPSERQMMTSLQRSRPTIREALRMLEHSGFISITAGASGAVVTDLDTRNVEQSLEIMLQASKVTLRELAEYRQANGIVVARWAALRHTSEDIATLKQTLVDSERHIADENSEEFIKSDMLFHLQLAKASQNEVAQVITKILRNMTVDIINRSFSRMSEAERKNSMHSMHTMHCRTFEAVQKGDEAEAAKTMVTHMKDFVNHLGEFE